MEPAKLSHGSGAEVAVWGHSILLLLLLPVIPERARARANSTCLPAPRWTLLICLQPSGSFLGNHQDDRDPFTRSAHTNPSLQEQSIQNFSPARPDLCLVRAAQSQEVSNQGQVFKETLWNAFVSKEKLKGAAGLFRPACPHSVLPGILYLIGRFLF